MHSVYAPEFLAAAGVPGPLVAAGVPGPLVCRVLQGFAGGRFPVRGRRAAEKGPKAAWRVEGSVTVPMSPVASVPEPCVSRRAPRLGRPPRLVVLCKDQKEAF